MLYDGWMQPLTSRTCLPTRLKSLRCSLAHWVMSHAVKQPSCCVSSTASRKPCMEQGKPRDWHKDTIASLLSFITAWTQAQASQGTRADCTVWQPTVWVNTQEPAVDALSWWRVEAGVFVVVFWMLVMEVLCVLCVSMEGVSAAVLVMNWLWWVGGCCPLLVLCKKRPFSKDRFWQAFTKCCVFCLYHPSYLLCLLTAELK